jgi:hypothetical protein
MNLPANIKAGSDVRRNWLTINGQLGVAGQHEVSLQRLAFTSARLGQAINDSVTLFFPFRVYARPYSSTVKIKDDADEELGNDWWRRFLVRGGLVNHFTATGCDDVTPASSESIRLTDDRDIIVPPDVASYYVWLECSGDAADGELSVDAASLHHGEDPTADNWDEFPAQPALPEAGSTFEWLAFILLATIDTLSLSEQKRSLVRQNVRGDLTAQLFISDLDPITGQVVRRIRFFEPCNDNT